MLQKPSENDIRQVTAVLELEPDTVLLSKILADKMKKGFIRRYRSLTFEPYLWTDNTPKHTFNTFNGFPLLRYKPTSKKSWRETPLFNLFWKAYAWEDQTKLDGVLNLLAYWLQFCHERDERILVLLSEAHGIGKSFWAQILSSLFSPELVIFFNIYAEFADTFNLCLANRLFWFVDDCSGLTATQAQSLNSVSYTHLTLPTNREV